MRNILVSSLVFFGLVTSNAALADKVIYSKKKSAGKKTEEQKADWKFNTQGGLSYTHPTDDRYWFKLSGTLRLDEAFFMGSSAAKGSDFPSGGTVRKAETFFDGGLGEHWEYTVGLQYDGTNVKFGDTFLSYDGIIKNNEVYAGRLSGNWFGLDNSNSTSWNPFLERSLPSGAFYIGDGIGVGTDFWWHNGGFTLMAFQPDQNADAIGGSTDRWAGTARLTLAPACNTGNVWHMGISGAYREMVTDLAGVDANKGARFSTDPSARARNTAKLLDTNRGNGGRTIQANNWRMFNVELARQIGSLMLEGEYTNVFVHRVHDEQGTLRFHGWNMQTRYLLTGEMHEYDVRNGQFGSLTPKSKSGAWEVAARYDYANLNNKNVEGGSEHNLTLGLNWFINKQVRLSSNYIKARIHPANGAELRKLDILAMRLQVRFK